MKITKVQLKQVIKEEAERFRIENQVRRIFEGPEAQAAGKMPPAVQKVQKFADECCGGDVEQVHALWDWYNDLISAGKWASDPDVRNTAQGKLFDSLMKSDVTSADIQASIEALGGVSSAVSGPV